MMHYHNERLKQVRPTVDTSIPSSMMLFVPKNYPNKRIIVNNGKITETLYVTQVLSFINNQFTCLFLFSTAEKERIAKENYALAQKLFVIMEKPGITVATQIQKTPHAHPGTINFKQRLVEAQKSIK